VGGRADTVGVRESEFSYTCMNQNCKARLQPFLRAPPAGRIASPLAYQVVLIASIAEHAVVEQGGEQGGRPRPALQGGGDVIDAARRLLRPITRHRDGGWPQRW